MTPPPLPWVTKLSYPITRIGHKIFNWRQNFPLDALLYSLKVNNCNRRSLKVREGFRKKKKNMVGFIHQAGWLGSAGGQNPTKTNIVFKKNYKDDQNGLIHPEIPAVS